MPSNARAGTACHRAPLKPSVVAPFQRRGESPDCRCIEIEGCQLLGGHIEALQHAQGPVIGCPSHPRSGERARGSSQFRPGLTIPSRFSKSASGALIDIGAHARLGCKGGSGRRYGSTKLSATAPVSATAVSPPPSRGPDARKAWARSGARPACLAAAAAKRRAPVPTPPARHRAAPA